MNDKLYLIALFTCIVFSSSNAMEDQKRKLDELYDNEANTPNAGPPKRVCPPTLEEQRYNFNIVCASLAKAAEEGDTQAQFDLAQVILEYSLGTYNNLTPSDLLKEAANRGHVEANWLLGKIYGRGIGVPRDPILASTYFDKALNLEDVKSIYKVAMTYYQGLLVNRDEAKALNLFHTAADRGCMKSQYILGTRYLSGSGIGHSYAQARKYFKLSADQGHPDACFQLGGLLLGGQPGKNAIKAAERYFDKAMNLGNELAALFLAHYYKKGTSQRVGFAQNYVKSAHIYASIANCDESVYNNQAQFKLGKMFEKGKGVAVDWAKAGQQYKSIRERVRAENDEDDFGVKAKKRLKKLRGRLIS